jgi:DRTGG domain.
MKLAELAELCGLEIVLAPDPETEVTGVYTSDLLSDVMAHCQEGSVLVTVQNHKNSIAVCTLVGSPAVVLVHGRPVPDDMLDSATREGVALLRTGDDQFAVSCKLGVALGLVSAANP